MSHRKEDKIQIIVRIRQKLWAPCRQSRRKVAQASNGMIADVTGLYSLSEKKDERGDHILVRIGEWDAFSRQGLEKIDAAEDWEPLWIKSPLLLLAECADDS
jgi:hypothetical protein